MEFFDFEQDEDGYDSNRMFEDLAPAPYSFLGTPDLGSLFPVVESPNVESSGEFGEMQVQSQSRAQGTNFYQEANPLDRWRMSPPEHEPASASAISNAVASTLENEGNTYPSSPYLHHSQHSNGSLDFTIPRALSTTSSLEIAKSSGSEYSFSSLISPQRSGYNSSGSNGSRSRSTRASTRRRRRKPTLPMNKSHNESEKRPYKCTFCTDSFKTKYDWQRHEKTLHLNLEQWHCAPTGPTNPEDHTCSFCGHPSPSPSHITTHNYHPCAAQPPALRTFYRKDHLRQHLRLSHNACKYHPPTMDAWVLSSFPSMRSRCGFCDARMTGWSERVEHLAAHFRQGKTMDQWEGERGFDVEVDALVENAIPPYLVGSESRTLDPFSASNASHRWQNPATAPATSTANASITQPPGAQPGPMVTCVYRLEEELSSYVKAEISRGNVPTDGQIRDHARVLVYGDVDPWNDTRADFPEWMEAFKQKVGLMAFPGREGVNVFVGGGVGDGG